MKKQNPSLPASGAGAAASVALVTSRTVTIWMGGLVFLVIGAWVLLALHVFSGNGAGPNSTAGGASARSTGTKAPWGRLEYIPITISPPRETLPLDAPPTSRKVEWHFPDIDSQQLAALLSEIGLSDSLREELVSLADVNPGIEGFTVHPTAELVLGLNPKDRSALYAVLAGCRDNVDQTSAFRFCGDSLDEWASHLTLSSETRKLIEPLVYRYGSCLFFADLQSIQQSLPSPQQRSLLIEALSHESTFLVHVELTEESDLEGLANYWGRGGRIRDVRPILESLKEAGGEQRIDITYLLPPFARRRLYTYQLDSEESSRHNRDYHWSTMNFFSQKPDDRFCDLQEVIRALKEEYYRVYGNLRLGDVVAYFDDRAGLVHSAVFVADGIVFTNNHHGSVNPWMLMKLEDMKNYYPRRKGLQVRYYRRNDL